MSEINLPWAIAYAHDLPVADTTEIKLSLTQLIGQLEKLLPTMQMDELPQWLTRFEKIEQGRMKYLIACRERAQTLLDWQKFRLDNPEAAALRASAHALQFGLELGIKPEDWPRVSLNDLRARLHAYLRSIRNDLMLASLDVLYIKTIAMITVTEKDHEVSKQLEALVNRTKQSTHMH